MALLNIEYGSIASSDTMNRNFSYLDERISDSNTQINASISSILSNIATINSRLSEISESFASSVSTLESTITEYNAKTKLLVSKSGMVPNWSSCRSVNFSTGTNYTATANGYLLILANSASKGNLSVNGSTVSFKLRDNSYDNAACLVAIPLMEGDVVSTTVTCQYAYFVPAAEINVENF